MRFNKPFAPQELKLGSPADHPLRPKTEIKRNAIKTSATRRHTNLHRSQLLAVILAPALSLLSIPPAEAYVSPTTGTDFPGAIVRPFDKPAQNWLSGHRGVDLDASPGQIIYSAGNGTVAFAGNVAGTPVVSIDHEPAKRTTYQPIHAFVRRGDVVTEGQPIGYLALTASGHRGLHWGLLTGEDQYENPLSLLEKPVIRLKPVGEHS